MLAILKKIRFPPVSDNKIPVEFIKAWERPQDMSFALTHLLKDKDFNTAIDSQKIGALGFSFGGYTVIALAGGIVDYPVMIHYYRTIGHREMEFPEFPGLGRLLYDSTLLEATKHVPNLKDNRIKAFFALSPGNREESAFHLHGLEVCKPRMRPNRTLVHMRAVEAAT